VLLEKLKHNILSNFYFHLIKMNYQGLLQKWIVRKKHKNSKQLNALLEEYKQITNHICMIEEKKREYEKLLRRIYKL
jgi:hypothetical protein